MKKGVPGECVVLCKDENTIDTKTRSTFQSKCEKHLPWIRNCTHPPGKLKLKPNVLYYYIEMLEKYLLQKVDEIF